MDFIVTSPTIKKILLYRENVVAAYLSIERATRTTQSNLRIGEAPKTATPSEFCDAGFLDFLTLYEEFYADIISKPEITGQLHLSLAFEQVARYDLSGHFGG